MQMIAALRDRNRLRSLSAEQAAVHSSFAQSIRKGQRGGEGGIRVRENTSAYLRVLNCQLEAAFGFSSACNRQYDDSSGTSSPNTV